MNNLEEPLPNEMHRYCHLCKQYYDDYLEHIDSTNHKNKAMKYTKTFTSINNTFSRITTFWQNKKNDDENNNRKKVINKYKQNEINIEKKIEYENDKLNEFDNVKKRMMSQLHQSLKEGCQAKRKLIAINSQLSTAQSSPMLAPVKRKKNNIKGKSKSKKNKNINEFLERGEFIINFKKKE